MEAFAVITTFIKCVMTGPDQATNCHLGAFVHFHFRSVINFIVILSPARTFFEQEVMYHKDTTFGCASVMLKGRGRLLGFSVTDQLSP